MSESGVEFEEITDEDVPDVGNDGKMENTEEKDPETTEKRIDENFSETTEESQPQEPNKETEGKKKEDSRIGACRIVKEEGNEHYRKGDYVKALESYEKCLRFAGMMFKDQDKEIAQPIRRDVHLNMAMACIKKKEYGEAKHHCNIVLTELGYKDNLKAFYRRGLAWKGMVNFNKAEKDFKKVLEFDGENVDAEKQIKLMKETEKSSKKKHKKIFGGMFKKGKIKNIYEDKKDLVNKDEEKEKKKWKWKKPAVFGALGAMGVVGLGLFLWKRYKP